MDGFKAGYIYLKKKISELEDNSGENIWNGARRNQQIENIKSKAG